MHSITQHSKLVTAAIADNGERATKYVQTVPLFPMGWDPSPRIDHKAPWIDYPQKPYAKAATPEELVQGGKRFAAAIKEDERLQATFAGHVMLFAWNEFEEGAWICPTYNADLSVNTQRVKAVSTILEKASLNEKDLERHSASPFCVKSQCGVLIRLDGREGGSPRGRGAVPAGTEQAGGYLYVR